MKLNKQTLIKLIKEELADSAAPTPDLHADITKLIKQIGTLQVEINDWRRTPRADPEVRQMATDLWELAQAVAKEHGIDVLNLHKGQVATDWIERYGKME